MLLNFREKVNIRLKRLGTDIKNETKKIALRGLMHRMIMRVGGNHDEVFKIFLKNFFLPQFAFFVLFLSYLYVL